jgi:hypothetical protein
MVGGAAIKGISKLLKRRAKLGGKGAIKKKPIYDYGMRRKVGSEAFLNRREQMAGVKAATIKAPRKPGYVEGAVTGAVATGAAMKYNEGKKAKAKEKKDDLKKAVDKHREEDKKKKKAYGKRAPKKDKNYGGK